MALWIELERPGQLFFDSREAPEHLGAFEGEARHAHRESQFRSHPRPGIARNGDVIDFGKFRAGSLQAVVNRFYRQSRGVLHAIEAFLFDRSNQLAIDNNGG